MNQLRICMRAHFPNTTPQPPPDLILPPWPWTSSNPPQPAQFTRIGEKQKGRLLKGSFHKACALTCRFLCRSPPHPSTLPTPFPFPFCFHRKPTPHHPPEPDPEALPRDATRTCIPLRTNPGKNYPLVSSPDRSWRGLLRMGNGWNTVLSANAPLLCEFCERLTQLSLSLRHSVRAKKPHRVRYLIHRIEDTLQAHTP